VILCVEFPHTVGENNPFPQQREFTQQTYRRFTRIIHRLCTGCAKSFTGCSLVIEYADPAPAPAQALVLVESVILFDATCELSYLVVDRSSLFHELGDLLIGIHNRRVVPIAKQLADLR